MTVQIQREMYLTETQPYYSGGGMECVCARAHARIHALAPCIPWSRSEQGVSFEMKHA